MTELAKQDAAQLLERVVVGGDLSKLSSTERMMYYKNVCESVGLNPLTKPFEYINLNNKLTLYARRDATDQLRAIHSVSIEEMTESEREGVYIVTVKARNKDGRTDMAKGAVNIANLKGDHLANAMMKAETKAKRRVTLSLCGLGLLDESEIETIPNAKVIEEFPDVPDLTLMSAGAKADHRAAMEAASTLLELQTAFSVAVKAAQERGDHLAKDEFIIYKDKLKEKLTKVS